MAFDYASRDYASIRASMLARAARVLPEWTDRDSSDFGVLMVDLWAYAADVMHYYIDKAARETFITTATQRESLLALASLFDYTPNTRTSASGTVTLQNDNASATTIAQYTEFTLRYNDKTYVAYAPSSQSLTASTTTAVSINEGTIVQNEVLTSASSGRTNQIYTIANAGVVHSSAVVNVKENGVDNVAYRRVANISTTAAGDRAYMLTETSDGFTKITFGSDANGFVPPSNSSITITYAYSSGASGNIPANSVSAFKNNTPSGVSISSSSALTGGRDDETLESLKVTVPTVISAQNRAVTLQDYIDLTLQIPGIAKAHASESSGTVTVYPQVDRSSDFLTTTDTSETISATLQTAVESYLSDLATVGVTVDSATSITWDTVDVTATVTVKDNYIQSEVETAVGLSIDELFKFENVKFGQIITLGELYQKILATDGVSYAVVSVFDNNGTALETTIAINAAQLPKKGTVTLTMSGGIT